MSDQLWKHSFACAIHDAKSCTCKDLPPVVSLTIELPDAHDLLRAMTLRPEGEEWSDRVMAAAVTAIARHDLTRSREICAAVPTPESLRA